MKSIFLFLFILSIFNVKADTPFPGKKENFHGFDMYVDGKNRFVIPHKVADGKPWVWRARFFGHEPQFDIAMLKKGYHVVYCDVAGLFGSSEAIKLWDEFYAYLRLEHLLADKPILEGYSRGGLIVYNWAARNPDKVGAIYADAPVMDFKSWPKVNPTIMKLYGFKDEEAARAYKKNPVDNLKPLADAGIPIIHVVGDVDKVVPVSENTAVAENRYKKMGGIFKVIHKPEVGHHPHSLKDPTPIVDFVISHTQSKKSLSASEIVSDKNFILRGNFNNSRIQFEKEKVGHVAFIGGSITKMEGYRPMVYEILKERFPDTEFTFTAAGISSTCSDTGAFRLKTDVLSKGPVDLFFVEYAVNDDQDGNLSRENCMRGMEGVIAQVREHNPYADIVMTHFVNESILTKLQNGEKPVSVQAHSDVAAHHGISVNHLAQEVADCITAGTLDWKRFGGVHPAKYGNAMCASMIKNALMKEWEKPLPDSAAKVAHKKSPLMDPKSYSRGRFLPVSAVDVDANWQISIPEWKKKIKGNVRERFLGQKFIHSEKAGAKLTIKFTGIAIGAYILAGPDAGIVRCRIDGGKTVEVDPIHRFSGFHYPRTVMFFNELEEGDHVLELEILENRDGRLKPGGTAFRVLHFTAN